VLDELQSDSLARTSEWRIHEHAERVLDVTEVETRVCGAYIEREEIRADGPRYAPIASQIGVALLVELYCRDIHWVQGYREIQQASAPGGGLEDLDAPLAHGSG